MDLAHDEVLSDIEGQDGSGLLSQDGHAMPVKFHPLAQLFPMIEGAEFAALVEDVKANGVRRPVVLFEGMVLDGRNRYLAAREAGIGYPVVEFTGSDPRGFVISENLRRRHMTEGQRAMVAKRLETIKHGDNQHTVGDANLHVLRVDAATALQVSPRSVASAARVIDHGTAELIKAVDAGTVSVSAAAEVAKLPEPTQADIVAEGAEAVKDAAAILRSDATIYEKLKAGDPETVATVQAQIMDAVKNPAPRPKSPRANPMHEPNPAMADAATVGDCANQIAEVVARCGPKVLDAIGDAAAQARAVAKVIRARDALNAILEERHGTR